MRAGTRSDASSRGNSCLVTPQDEDLKWAFQLDTAHGVALEMDRVEWVGRSSLDPSNLHESAWTLRFYFPRARTLTADGDARHLGSVRPPVRSSKAKIRLTSSLSRGE